MKSKIPLTVALLDQILFAMEDQDNLSVLNLETGKIEVCLSENPVEDASLVPLPVWTSTDGFRMMREFSEGLRNPSVQAELRFILDTGLGVFKNFKNALKPHEAIYRQWLRFKRHFMESAIHRWAQDWDEILSWEVTEMDQVIASDFEVSLGGAADGQLLAELDDAACRETGDLIFGPEDAGDFSLWWRKGRLWEKQDRLWKVLSPEALCAGVLWARPWKSSATKEVSVEVLLWYVNPDLRGLGLGRSLLETFLEDSQKREDRRVLFPVLPQDRETGKLLTRRGFEPKGRLWVHPGWG